MISAWLGDKEVRKLCPRAAPDVASEAWTTFVADAIAKEPRRRSAAEREAIAMARAIEQAKRAVEH